MSYELVNQSLEICRTFSRQSWAKALELARSYGWQPKGTEPPFLFQLYQLEAEWNGTYLTNDGQVVTAADALALASALQKSLEYIPDANFPIDWTFESWLEDDLPEWLSPEEKAMIEEELQEGMLDIMGINPSEFFAGNEKKYLRDFIKFCHLGSFEIL